MVQLFDRYQPATRLFQAKLAQAWIPAMNFDDLPGEHSHADKLDLLSVDVDDGTGMD